jgi:Methyltransferase domain
MPEYLSRILKALRHPERIPPFLLCPVINFAVGKLKRNAVTPADLLECHAAMPTDICEHLRTIYNVTVAAKPRLIVELGFGKESNLAFSLAAKECGANLLSVDIVPSGQFVSSYSGQHFVQDDDVHFAGKFPAWCEQNGITPLIDVLFIDTNHLYEHTRREIASWFPYLNSKPTVIFHDTNVRLFYRLRGGYVGRGCDNERGVTRALEEYLGSTIEERRSFVKQFGPWLVTHYSHCNGLTIFAA